MPIGRAILGLFLILFGCWVPSYAAESRNGDIVPRRLEKLAVRVFPGEFAQQALLGDDDSIWLFIDDKLWIVSRNLKQGRSNDVPKVYETLLKLQSSTGGEILTGTTMGTILVYDALTGKLKSTASLEQSGELVVDSFSFSPGLAIDGSAYFLSDSGVVYRLAADKKSLIPLFDQWLTSGSTTSHLAFMHDSSSLIFGTESLTDEGDMQFYLNVVSLEDTGSYNDTRTFVDTEGWHKLLSGMPIGQTITRRLPDKKSSLTIQRVKWKLRGSHLVTRLDSKETAVFINHAGTLHKGEAIFVGGTLSEPVRSIALNVLPLEIDCKCKLIALADGQFQTFGISEEASYSDYLAGETADGAKLDYPDVRSCLFKYGVQSQHLCTTTGQVIKALPTTLPARTSSDSVVLLGSKDRAVRAIDVRTGVEVARLNFDVAPCRIDSLGNNEFLIVEQLNQYDPNDKINWREYAKANNGRDYSGTGDDPVAYIRATLVRFSANNK